MTVLSIQSAVAFGYVGNAAAVPALQALGQNAWRVDTVSFSNHPGHGRFAGRAIPAAEISEIIEGIKAVWTPDFGDAVLSGYLGQAATAGVVADAVLSLRQHCPGLLYVLDPVIGDDGRVFVEPAIVPEIRRSLIPVADIVVPNVSELGWLTGAEISDQAAMLAAAARLLDCGPGIVVVTGVREAGEIAAYGVTADGVWRAAACYRDRNFNGTGDLFAALLTGFYLERRDLPTALAAAAAGLDLVTGATARSGARELTLVAALPRIRKIGAAEPADRVA